MVNPLEHPLDWSGWVASSEQLRERLALGPAIVLVVVGIGAVIWWNARHVLQFPGVKPRNKRL